MRCLWGKRDIAQGGMSDPVSVFGWGWGDGFDSLGEEAVDQSCGSGFEMAESLSRGEGAEQSITGV